ncbi:hypothetical protein [Altererythrobacter sp. Root672]|uniref:hypothetical protein n=1 Tax=Altererythrobacter sp. Root672 TaxID=1736584 RepID=UPI0006FF20FD|nr:hypothetical protein [Altererythrobacter sp. Root672]KRA80479.1 hypothetical protein ASD76_15040 [Altererythrobacter sp. Root672]
MIRASRRGVLAGALAVPTVAGLAHWRWRHGEASVLLHDPALEAGRRFAEAGATRGGEVVAIEGDRIRLARKVLERKPALIAGVSRHADALMIEEVAREAGYVPVAALHGRGRACTDECQPGWAALGRLAQAAEGNWIEALADYAVRPGELAGASIASALPARADPGLVVGWLLVQRG